MESTNNLEYKDINKKSILFKTNRDELSTVKNNLSNLKLALEQAKSIDYPNRYQLYNLYTDILEDAHLSSVLKHRKSRITGLPFTVSKINNKSDDVVTSLFNQLWFKKFLDYTIESIFWGNSLVEILNDRNGISVNLIPRMNVIPEFKQVKKNAYDFKGSIDYSAPIYSSNLVDLNNNYSSRDLGELLSIVKLVLFKNEVMLNWSQYIELFGQPIRVATSDTDDPIEQNQIFSFLKDLGRSGYVIKNSSTQLDFIENSGSGKSELYKDFVNLVNGEISKKLLGGTMLTDDGSSKSQSEVHERGSLLFTKSDILYVEYVINTLLIPMLQDKGIIKTKSLEFKFSEPEIYSVDEKIKVDEFLLANFNVTDIEYFIGRYGVNLEPKTINNIEE